MPLCSLIIPVYNRATLTRQCLDRLLAHPPLNCDREIVVVDDASADGTPRLLAGYRDRIRVVSHAENKGFAQSCNEGVAAAKGEYLVFLNNDTVPLSGWLDALVHYTEARPEAAAVGSKLLSPDGTIQHAGMVIGQDRLPHHIYLGFPSDHPAVNQSRRFQAVTGACLLIRRAVFAEAGGFDSAYRNGYEDLDLCLRLGERGHEVHYCHESVLFHLESVSEGRTRYEEENARLYRSRWAHCLRPDDWQYYCDDGLIEVAYATTSPLRIRVAPELALVNETTHQPDIQRLLARRAEQVYELLRENILLRVSQNRPGDFPVHPTIPVNGHGTPDSGVPFGEAVA